MKVAVIGGHDMVTGFRLLGVSYARFARDSEEAREIYGNLCRDPEVKVVICEEGLAGLIPRSSGRRGEEIYPLLVEIPGSRGAVFGRETVRERVKRAIGIDIGTCLSGGDGDGSG
ncbi:MAG: V-type ATP synthase subunit F [Methanoculleaceae archaeon]